MCMLYPERTSKSGLILDTVLVNERGTGDVVAMPAVVGNSQKKKKENPVGLPKVIHRNIRRGIKGTG